MKVSSAAIASGSASGDDRYADLEGALAAITTQRDALAGQILDVIDGAAFGGRAVNEDRAEGLTEQAQDLLDRANELAGNDD